jgi:hypothetical protein
METGIDLLYQSLPKEFSLRDNRKSGLVNSLPRQRPAITCVTTFGFDPRF